MNKRINIGDKEKAIIDISQFSLKHYRSTDIEFFNIHLKELNSICKKDIFSKNNLYIHSSTLWELMQPEAQIGKHHFHGLSAEQIYYTIKSIVNPYCVYESYGNRYVVATSYLNRRNENLILIIELHAPLTSNRDANINKLITIYPKKNMKNIYGHLEKDKILYPKI